MNRIFHFFIFFSFVFPIVGGWEVDPECPDCKYPFNVSIQTYEYYILSELQPDLPTLWDGHFCQGSLISENWVLTTVDCIDIVESPSDIWVEIGLHNINNELHPLVDSIAVNNIFFHPSYNSEQPWHYNYALLELSEPTDYEPIQLISNSTYEEIGDSVSVMGWGARSWTFSWIHAYLLFENNSTIDECLDGWNGDETLLCLTPWDLNDYEDWEMHDSFEEGFPGGACTGDEGASLIITNDDGEYELLGNFYLGCVLDYPHQNKYSKVSTVKNWIYSYIGYPCEEGAFVNISIVFDDNPDETSWELWYHGENPDGGYLYLVNSGSGSEQNICISDEGVYEFVIYDEGGDGLSEYPYGSYSVTLDTGGWGTPDEEIVVYGGYFDSSDSTLFAWPDSDGDLIINSQDIQPDNEFVCSDTDNDNCDDCSSGIFDLENDCSYDLGDVNLDGQINIIDVIALVEYVLDEEYNNSADINIDGIVNIVDIVTLVNIILN